ncbi:MAG TPA: ABC transporter permease [Acidobacteriota bacterium]|nr:ABC transporter permease [Acidobacteriota bacterium]
MLKALIYYWRTNLAVLLGCAVATAVLTGALVVGDSVKASLRSLAVERLGDIDYAVVAPHLFRQALAQDLASEPQFQEGFEKAAPALFLNGTAVHAESDARASGVNVYGIDQSFQDFFAADWDLSTPQGQFSPSIIVNETLARELGASEGDALLLSFQQLSDIHPETLLGGKDPDDVVQRIRLQVKRIVPDRGLGRFGLRPNQNLPRNAFVALEVLQERLEQPGRANALVMASKQPVAAVPRSASGGGPTQDDSEGASTDSGLPDFTPLAQALESAAQLEDYALKLQNHGSYLSLESREFVLSRRLSDAAIAAAQEVGLQVQPVLSYLANKIELDGRMIPYSTVTAVDAGHPGYQPERGPFGRWTTVDWRHAKPLEMGQIYLNTWAADDLAAEVGDEVRLTYYEVGEGDQLTEDTITLTVQGVLRISELAADRNLVAEYPGIADADNMAEWDPTFPVDLSLIREEDEEYWDRYRSLPKAFVSLAQGQQLWTTRFGDLTAVRLALPQEEWTDVDAAGGSSARPGASSSSDTSGGRGTTPRDTSAGQPSDEASGADTPSQQRYRQALTSRLRPESFGFNIQPVKSTALQASSGATDFGQLFLGFSFFLIISAALLVGLLFRLGAEQRAPEIGTLLAVGYTPGKVQRRFLGEGLIIAVLGGALGLAGALGYAWLMLAGLRTWWVEAVGSPFLTLHVHNLSLGIGFAISLLVVILSIWQAVRRMSKLPAPALLRGVTSIHKQKGPSLSAKLTAWIFLLLAVLLLAGSFFVEGMAATGMFFGVGACLLISGLGFFAIWCRSDYRTKVLGSDGSERITIPLALRNTSRAPGRSLLSASLVAVACFMIVAVGSFHQDFGEEVLQRDSGAGGFPLLAQSDIPIHRDLNNEDTLFDLGFSDPQLDLMDNSTVYSLRLRPGEDASCLNLYKPQRPRILGVPDSLIERGGFSFQAVMEDDELGASANASSAQAQASQPSSEGGSGGEQASQSSAAGAQNGTAGNAAPASAALSRPASASSPSGSLDPSDNPWALLQLDLGPGVIPAFADANSATWILKVPLGGEIPLEDDQGNEIRLKIVGLLQTSIFQSELLISERHFLDRFPSRDGHQYFLIDTPVEQQDQVSTAMESALAPYGFDATTTVQKLADYHAVQNTYLSTFQTLGGLGLLLGTIGLAVILTRNVLERRKELATLRAFGFRPGFLGRVIFNETAFLLILGLALGTLSALLAVAPQAITHAQSIPWLDLLLTLVAIFAVGLLASTAALRQALKTPLLPALKEDR